MDFLIRKQEVEFQDTGQHQAEKHHQDGTQLAQQVGVLKKERADERSGQPERQKDDGKPDQKQHRMDQRALFHRPFSGFQLIDRDTSDVGQKSRVQWKRARREER